MQCGFNAHGKLSLPCFSSLTAGSSDEDSSFIFSILASFLGFSSSPPFSFPHFDFGEGGMVSEASFDLESPALAPVTPSDGSGFSLGAVSFSVSYSERQKENISHNAKYTHMHRHTKPQGQPVLHSYTYLHTHTLYLFRFCTVWVFSFFPLAPLLLLFLCISQALSLFSFSLLSNLFWFLRWRGCGYKGTNQNLVMGLQVSAFVCTVFMFICGSCLGIQASLKLLEMARPIHLLLL